MQLNFEAIAGIKKAKEKNYSALIFSFANCNKKIIFIIDIKTKRITLRATSLAIPLDYFFIFMSHNFL